MALYHDGSKYSVAQTFTWVNGRQLGALQKGDLSIEYGYNADGLRTFKSVNNIRTEYVWDGSSLIGQKTGNNVLVYLYAADGLAGFQYNGVNYYYLKNGQGDVVGILDSSGTLVAKYTYDAWGKLLSVTDAAGNDKSADASFIGNINPVRYRSYYYDTETGLYYLQSRYYDPEVGRFINADRVVTEKSINGYNLFAYCLNNPICNFDYSGYSPEFLSYPKLTEERLMSSKYQYIFEALNGYTAEARLYFEKLGQRESGGNYSIVNEFGYMGKYQMGKTALTEIGFYKDGNYTATANMLGVYSDEDFLNTPLAQEVAIQYYTKRVWGYMQTYECDKYIGKSVNGVVVTQAGLIAGAHLVGVGAVRNYFKGGNPQDGYGTSVKSYMELMSGIGGTIILW